MITKYDVYLNEQEQHKLETLARITGKSSEEIINNLVYGRLQVLDVFFEDPHEGEEPPQDQTEIFFYISDEEARELNDFCVKHGLNDFTIDECVKALLLATLHPERAPGIIEAIRSER